MNNHEKVIIECESGFIESRVWHTGQHLALNPNGHFNLRVDGEESLNSFIRILFEGGTWINSGASVSITLGSKRVYFRYAEYGGISQTITMTKGLRDELANQALIALKQKD